MAVCDCLIRWLAVAVVYVVVCCYLGCLSVALAFICCLFLFSLFEFYLG